MPVYDDEKTEAERLRQITGIGKEEESAMEDQAKAGAAEDRAISSKVSGGHGKNIDNGNLGKAESVGDKIGGGYNDADSGSRLARARSFAGRHKKAGAGGGILIALLGGGFFGLSLLSGPLQFLKVAHDLENFHFFHLQDAGDQRSGGIMKDLREIKAAARLVKGGDLNWERTRMGAIGNAVADRYEAKLASAGIKYTTTAGGIITQYVVLDPEKMPDLQGLSDEEAVTKLMDEYGIKDGQLIANPEKEGAKLFRIKISDLSSNPLKFNKFNRFLIKNAGENALSQRIGERFLDARFKLSWHYMSSALNQKAGEAYDKWKARMNDNQETTIEEGATDTGVGDSKQENCKKGDTACEERNKEARANTDEGKKTLSDAKTGEAGGFGSDELKKLTKNLTDKLTSKTAAGVGGIIAALCIIKSLNDSYTEVKMAEVIIPLVRIAMEFMSLGSQIKSGQEVDTGQLGYYSQALYDNSTDKNDPYAGTSWNQAQSQNAEEINSGSADAPQLNKDGTVPGVKPDNPLQNISKGSPLAWIGDVPGLGAACSTVGSFIVGLLGGGPIGSIIGAIVGPLITKIPGVGSSIAKFAGMIVGWMVGAPVTAFPQGAQTGNYLNYGARLGANAQAITSGGGALSQSQVAQLDKSENQQLQQQFESNSFADRIFNPYLNGSLLNRIATGLNPSIASNVASMFTHISSIFSDLISVPAHLFYHPAQAAGSVNLEQVYGFPEYGFSQAELNDPATSDPYQNSINAANLLDQQCTDSNGNPDTSCALITQANNCFDVNIVGTRETDSATNQKYNQWDVQVSGNAQSANNKTFDPYSSDYPSNCNDDSAFSSTIDGKQVDWQTIRFFIFDTETMKSLGCYGGDAGSCTELGFANS